MRRNRLYLRYAPAVLLFLLMLTPIPLLAQPRVGAPVPDFKVITTSGQPVTAQNSRSSVLIIDFFATWCQPCRQSIPHLSAMNAKYGKQGLKVLGMNVDDEGEKALGKFSSSTHINYPIALAGEQIQAAFGIRSVPVMFLIDRNGRVAEIYRGFSDDIGRAIEMKIKKLLLEK
jgi:cytochrome c biogenesis protein CcmG, thiol:disulfide interchange protein DsbE